MLARILAVVLALLPALGWAQVARTPPQWPAMVGSPADSDIVMVWRPSLAGAGTAMRHTTVANYFSALTSAQIATSLGYTPANGANYLALAGGTMTGALVLSGAPTISLHAATKAYVDSVAGGAAGLPGGSSGQMQYNNAGAFGGVPAVNGDGTLNTTTGALVVTKTNGSNFAPSATTDTTNASNIASGTLGGARQTYGTTSNTAAQGNDSRIVNAPLQIDLGQPAVAFKVVIPFAVAETVPANLVWMVTCSVNPGADMTIVWKKKISGSITTIGNIVIASSNCGVTNPGNTTFNLVAAGDGMILEVPADASAILGISAVLTK